MPTVGRALVVATATLVAVAAPPAAYAGFAEDVGFSALQQQLGAATPTGAGVPVAQVEGSVTVQGQSTWAPDPANSEFAGKSITDLSGAPPGLYSSHATGVGQSFYGTVTSIAPAIADVSVYWATDWLGAGFLWTTGVRRPAFTAARIVNHSWVGDATASNGEVLARLDWVAETDELVIVAGLNNGSGTASRPLIAGTFNGIAVGRSDGLHQSGSVAVDATYTADRMRPDLVAPAPTTSRATPEVSSMVALLIEAARGQPGLATDPVSQGFTNRAGVQVRNPERVEVIRAALMAGADRVTRNTASINLALYRATAAEQSANGLDRRYGAGQANILNSYLIVAAGEQNSAEDGGPGSGSASRGFDYDPAFGGAGGTNSTGTYALPTAATPQLLTATLAWNLDVNGGTPNSFSGAATLRDLALTVLDVTSPSNPVTVWTSQSTTENTENAWLVVPAGAQYALRVSRGSGGTFNYDYGIAWQLLPDADGDGAPDGHDNCVDHANGPIVRDAGGRSQHDTDDDGFGNRCDADLDDSGGLVNAADLAIFRAVYGIADADADFDGSGGIVNAADLAIFRALFAKPPGPSAYVP
jgi:hypothetical protein